MNRKNYWYCPKCGNIGLGGLTEICSYCHAHMMEAPENYHATWDIVQNMSAKAVQLLESKIFKNLVKTNPQFDINVYKQRLHDQHKANEDFLKEQSKSQHQPHCPTCGSTDIEKIRMGNKVGAGAIFGLFALGHINKTFKCNNCGYKW